MVMVPVAVGEVPVGVGDLGDGGAGSLLVDDGLAGGVGGDEGLDGQVVHGARVTTGGGMDQGSRIIAEKRVRAGRRA